MKRRAALLCLLALFVSWSISGTAHANSTVGAWALGPVWDIAPINMLVLPNGKVMFYPGNTISGDDPRMWDPGTNTLTNLAKAGYDLFCNGHSFMKDGTILFTGGNLLTPFNGLPNASIYNPFTNIWTHLPDMNAARWYPSTTTLANGDVLVMTGTIDSTQLENPLPQIWQPASGSWRNLTNAMLKIYNYSWVYATPSGKAFVAGPDPLTRYLNTAGTGSWSTVDTTNFPRMRDYGSSVMYGPNNILIAGGGQPPTNTAEIINLTDAIPTWQSTNPMAFARRHMNMTLLPDDNVLVTGGTSADGFNNTTQPVYAAEMWNIATRTWTTMASQTRGRFYHSNSLLLPDGRVLSAGGDGVFQAEIYSPPYLFKGARPTITSAPPHARYGEAFFVGTPDATNIAKTRLIRLPAVTHAFDMNQRLIAVNFTQTSGGLSITAPSSGNLAPPGHYMLFILNSNGVPSVAKIIQIDEDPTTSTSPAAPTGLLATAASSNAINLTWADQSNNEAGFKIERAIGAGAFSPIITVGANVTAYANSGLTASTSYSYRVRATNSVGDSSYSNTVSATTPVAGTGFDGVVNVAAATLDSGFAYIVNQNFGTPGDTSTAPTQSALRIFENGIELGPAHSAHANIRTLGMGRFSHWGSNLYFSASDNTNPRTNGRTYAYRIGFSSTAPVAPSGLGATAASSSAINLSWTDASSNETGFKIERAVGGGAFSQVATVGTNVTTYADSGLAANTAYSYRVRASNTIGNSAYSNTAGATTPVAGTGFDGLVNVAATTLDSGFAYIVTQSFGTPGDTSAAPTQSALRIFENGTELGPAHSAHANIRALGLGRFSHWGSDLYFSASDNTNPRTNGRTYAYRIGFSSTAPAAPSSLGATAASSSAINLSWADQSNNETGFKIERAIGTGAFSQVATVGANVTTYANSGLTASTSYSYRVRATNSAGDSAYSNTASATTQASAVTIPGAPSSLGATAASSSTINLNWADQSNNETGFKIERAVGTGAFSQVATVGANVTTYANSGLTASTSYSYRVRATNSVGDSAYSNTAGATTQASAGTIPAAPSNLGATAVSRTQINLTWVDRAANESGFKIERRDGFGSFAQIATVGTNVTTYANTGLTRNKRYTYRVRAYNSAGNSAYSNQADDRTDR